MFPFDRIDADDAAKLTSEEALRRFQTLGFLWIRLPLASLPSTPSTSVANATESNSARTLKSLQAIYKDYPASLERKWSVENAGTVQNETDLSAAVILGGDNDSPHQVDRCYVSTIVSRQKDKECLEEYSLSLFVAEGDPFATIFFRRLLEVP